MGGVFSSIDPSNLDGAGTKVPTYDIPRPTKESAEKLTQLIKANHTTYGILFNHRRFHNHMPHCLTSAYFLGATPAQLTELYESNAARLVPWEEDSPQEVTTDDWQEFLGNKEYERGYYDFFSDRLEDAKFNWKQVVKDHMGQSDRFFNLLVGGLLHPLIHLGYAAELNSEEVGVESLTQTAMGYLDIDKINKIEPSQPVTAKTTDVLEIFNELREDKELGAAYAHFTRQFDTDTLIASYAPKFKYYQDRLDISSDLNQTINDLLRAAVITFTCSHRDGDPQYGFAMLHIVTSVFALRQIAPIESELFNGDQWRQLVVNVYTLALLLYAAERTPVIDKSRGDSVKIQSREDAWKKAIASTLTGADRHDLHFAKATRALLVAEQLFPEDGDFYAKVAQEWGEYFNKRGYASFDSDKRLDIPHKGEDVKGEEPLTHN